MTEDEQRPERAAGTLEPRGFTVQFTVQELVTFLGMFVAVALAGAALLGPWLSVTSSASSGPSFTDLREYGIGGWSATDSASGVSSTPSGTYLLWPDLGLVLRAVGIPTWLAFLTGLLAFILSLVRSRWPWIGRPLPYIEMAAAGCAWAGAVIFAALFPGALTAAGLLPAGAGFWGSGNAGGCSPAMTWGAGWAWYGLVVSGVLFVLMSLVRLAHRCRS